MTPALCVNLPQAGWLLQDDDFVGVLTKNIPNRLALTGNPGSGLDL